MTIKRILIIGFPFSGTSFLTHALHASGVRMWSRQERINAHKEDLNVLEWCESEQKRFGTDWRKRPKNYEPSRIFLSLLQKYRREREAEGVEVWGFKQPRIMIFLPAFDKVFGGKDCLWVVVGRSMSAWLSAHPRPTDYGEKKPKRLARRLKTFGSLCHSFSHDADKLDNVWLFDYNRSLSEQEADLSDMLGQRVDLASHWRPTRST